MANSNHESHRATAERFADLVSQCHKELRAGTLPEEAIQTLLDLVVAAGFVEAGTVEPGTASRYSQRSARLGHIGPILPSTIINSFHPYRVLDREGHILDFATGWLDNMIWLTYCAASDERGSDPTEIVQQEITRSRPLEPIQLTVKGDYLIEVPPSPNGKSQYPYLVDHTRDDDTLPASEVGRHQYCGGRLYRHQATGTQDTLVCPQCFLRAYIPCGVATYGELRQATNKQVGS